MRFSSTREKRLWILAASLLVGIYSTLYFARTVSDFLRDRNLLRTGVAVLFLLAFGLVLRWFIRRRPARREALVLCLISLIYLSIALSMERSEERLHLLEYGLFGALVYRALGERAGGEKSPSGMLRFPGASAVCLTVAAGWLDEGIQYLVPNRFYDLRDVAFNAMAGVLSIAAMKSLAWARGSDDHPPARGDLDEMREKTS